ncbi:hypothetical protein GCM10010289_39500 [Streptomyces violascens]|uniref:Uncharacterized protein n=1 Tax=Streptomyces violascens TaxID=67381 RepID=A0ABQ3QXJ1_9ACTN|nr:hypothetical protein GCM10010289_39500 [Streptomyces violascens]GHI42000.1 hypothetical protein Sviol_64080 [Streptomyces violascens]
MSGLVIESRAPVVMPRFGIADAGEADDDREFRGPGAMMVLRFLTAEATQSAAVEAPGRQFVVVLRYVATEAGLGRRRHRSFQHRRDGAAIRTAEAGSLKLRRLA